MTPLWSGPAGSGNNGGVTQSMLAKFLACPARFHAATVLGLRKPPGFVPEIEYGTMWHLCEEVWAAGGDWRARLREYARELCRQHRSEMDKVDHWYRACHGVFPEYVNYWAKHPADELSHVTQLVQEWEFDVPYRLPRSGRVVRLRGKQDGVQTLLRLGEFPTPHTMLFETKSKGGIDRDEVARTMSFDHQTSLYLVVLDLCRVHPAGPAWLRDNGEPRPIGGVRLNVVRRPFTSSPGNIRRKKGESKDDFFRRLVNEHVKTEPETWFARWEMRVAAADLTAYRETFLDPVLERLCDWYAQVTGCSQHAAVPANYRTPLHYRHPYNCRNFVTETNRSDYDEFLVTGVPVGLVRADRVFHELSGVEPTLPYPTEDKSADA